MRPLCFKPTGTRFRRCGGCPPARESHPRGRGTTNRATRRFSVRWAGAFATFVTKKMLKNLNIDATTFQRVVLTLHMCDMIEEEMLSRRKTVYTLKTAA